MSFMSECSHRSPQFPNSPLGRDIQPLGRDMPFCVVLVEFKLYIESFIDNGPHLVAPLAGVLDEIPFARSAPLRESEVPGPEADFIFAAISPCFVKIPAARSRQPCIIGQCQLNAVCICGDSLHKPKLNAHHLFFIVAAPKRKAQSIYRGTFCLRNSHVKEHHPFLQPWEIYVSRKAYPRTRPYLRTASDFRSKCRHDNKRKNPTMLLVALPLIHFKPLSFAVSTIISQAGRHYGASDGRLRLGS